MCILYIAIFISDIDKGCLSVAIPAVNNSCYGEESSLSFFGTKLSCYCDSDFCNTGVGELKKVPTV